MHTQSVKYVIQNFIVSITKIGVFTHHYIPIVVFVSPVENTSPLVEVSSEVSVAVEKTSFVVNSKVVVVSVTDVYT